jgi:hypothetical protein
MTDGGFVIVQYDDAIGIQAQDFGPLELRVRLSEVPTFISQIIGAVSRDTKGGMLIDEIVAAARARRPSDRTNAERQRRFRQRRGTRQQRANRGSEEITPS